MMRSVGALGGGFLSPIQPGWASAHGLSGTATTATSRRGKIRNCCCGLIGPADLPAFPTFSLAIGLNASRLVNHSEEDSPIAWPWFRMFTMRRLLLRLHVESVCT